MLEQLAQNEHASQSEHGTEAARKEHRAHYGRLACYIYAACAADFAGISLAYAVKRYPQTPESIGYLWVILAKEVTASIAMANKMFENAAGLESI